MSPRRQVLEAELKTVRTVRLSADPAVARAATEREKELQAELEKERSSAAQAQTKSSPN